MMKTWILVVVLVACVSGHVFAHVAKTAVQKDDAMLKLDNQVRELIVEHGNYDAALKVYASAARQHADNTYYKEQYAILRRVIKMKRAMEAAAEQKQWSEPDLKNWMSYHQAVRGYYYDQGFYGASLALDKTAFERLPTDDAALDYLETLVVQNETEAAQFLLSRFREASPSSPRYAALIHLMRARNNTTIAAAELQTAMEAAPQEHPRSFVYLGCAYQLQGDSEKAYKAITTALKNTPPTQMSMTRRLIDTMKEFEAVRQSEKYLAAVNTESTVYQSGCTGGSSCNSCSLKDKCPSNR